MGIAVPGPRELQGTSCDKDGRGGGCFCHTVPSPAAVTKGLRGYTELPAERSWLSFVSSCKFKWKPIFTRKIWIYSALCSKNRVTLICFQGIIESVTL